MWGVKIAGQKNCSLSYRSISFDDYTCIRVLFLESRNPVEKLQHTIREKKKSENKSIEEEKRPFHFINVIPLLKWYSSGLRENFLSCNVFGEKNESILNEARAPLVMWVAVQDTCWFTVHPDY